MALVGIALGAGSLLFPDADSLTNYGRLNIDGGSTISTSRALGAVVVFMFILTIAPGVRRHWRLACLLAAAGSLTLMLLVGSRGPFLSVAITIPLMIFTARLPARARIAGLISLAVSIALILAYSARIESTGVRRVLTFLSGDANNTSRSNLYNLASNEIIANPFGLGWYGFAHLKGAYGFAYPHNIVLEIFAEAGWLAGIAFLAYAGLALVKLRVTTSTTYGMAFYGLAIYWLTAAQFSNDINGNRITWAAMAFGFAELARRPRACQQTQSHFNSTNDANSGPPATYEIVTGDRSNSKQLLAPTPEQLSEVALVEVGTND